jgi:16S rRNA (adenine1518-N6/adenine1519-N6)-dimethyltransferase
LTELIEDLPSLKKVIAIYGLTANKRLGQHFILDTNFTDKIVRSVSNLIDHTVIEIGPGPGGLTRSLLKAGFSDVHVIEMDDRFLKPLKDLQDLYPVLHIHSADALKVDYNEMGDEKPQIIVANLPYNVATPLILKWLLHRYRLKSMTVMIQKEVADRLMAMPNTSDYGRLSVITQVIADVYPVMNVGPEVFTPPPKVDSTVVQIVFKEQKYDDLVLQKLQTMTHAAFGQRRKMLRSSLKTLGPEIMNAFVECGYELTLRAEDLSPQDYLKVALFVCNT